MNNKALKFIVLVLSFFGVKLVASCTQESFDVKAKACVNGFFNSIKQDPKQDCSLPYNEMKNCVNLLFYQCNKNSTDPKILTAIAHRASKLIASQSYYCEDGMLYSFKGTGNLPDCRNKAIKKARKCAASFQEKFRENMADPALCKKYTKAKTCIKKALGKYCKKTERIQNILKVFQNNFNPYCPGNVDADKKIPRSPSSPFGACTAREYMTLTRVCMIRFVQTIQKNPKKPCRSVFTKKLHNCAKDMALHCHRNESDYVKQNIEKSFARNRPFQQSRYCDGVSFGLSYPKIKGIQCKQEFYLAKSKCEENYVEAYKRNKADKSLCRKYAEAKRCAKNVTLALCEDTPQLRDEVKFIYDKFNPFCRNLSDPPAQKPTRRPGESMPRKIKIGTNLPMRKPTVPMTTAKVPSKGHAQSVSAQLFSFVMILGLLLMRVSVS